MAHTIIILAALATIAWIGWEEVRDSRRIGRGPWWVRALRKDNGQ
jgi:hypothetical protein